MKEIVTLTLLALIAGCLLASLDLLTRDRIALNQQVADATVLAGLVESTDLDVLNAQNIELLEVETKGYGGTMAIVIALRNGEILGVRVLRHSETPGFADVLRPTEWIDQFAHSEIQDIDAVSGATITTRAVLRAVGDALRHRKESQP